MKKILLVSVILSSCSFFTPCKAQSFPGFDFDSLSTGMTSPGARVLSFALLDSNMLSPLFAGGHFTIAGRNSASNVAEWIYKPANYNYFSTPPPGEWLALGSGTNNDVCALTMFNNYLYAGGKFDTAGGIAASHMARWDTSAKKWDSLVGQLNGNVYALCVYHNALYAGGDFTIADGDTVNRIAVWRDSVWAPVGKGFDTGAVYALTVSNDTLYAGGSFLKSNGIMVNHIAKLSLNKWDSVGSGTNNTVYALTNYYQTLCVGGAFTTSGGIATPYISVFDEYNTYHWQPFYLKLNDTVRALSGGYYEVPIINHSFSYNYLSNLLLVGGNFDTVNGYPDKYFTTDRYVDTSSRLSSPGPVFALTGQWPIVNYAGGQFQSVTNNISPYQQTLNNVAIFAFFTGGGGIKSLSNQTEIKVYPNPGNGDFTFQSSVVSGQSLVEVYNMLGEKVYSQLIIHSSSFIVNLSNQPNGIYLYRVIAQDGSSIGQGKVMIEK